jgi:hypothetical protein
MDLEPITKKRSLGKLRTAPKTKPRSPDMTGTLILQRHTAAAIQKKFEDSDADEVVCNIAGWVNQDSSATAGSSNVRVPTKNRLPAIPWAYADSVHSSIAKAITACRIDIFVSSTPAANIPQATTRRTWMHWGQSRQIERSTRRRTS